MSHFGLNQSDICVATSNRMAGTALSEYLRLQLGKAVAWSEPEGGPVAPVTVLLVAHEPQESVPRLLTSLRQSSTRIVFVYDGTVPHNELIETAMSFGVWSLCDARDDIAVLSGQVQRAFIGRVWEQDRMSERWARRLASDGLRLSRREAEVAQAFCGVEALDPDRIAERLGLSVNTVRVHLANIRRKLGDRYTGNRDALRTALLDHGWIE